MLFWVIEFKTVIDFSFVWCCDVMTSCHDVTKPDLPISACGCVRKLILFLFLWFFSSLSSNLLLIFHLYNHVTSWRHVMTSHNQILPISACRCARKLILSLFLWFFKSLSSNLLLISHLCDHMTSWRHVMTSHNQIYLSQLVDVLESWFFFCFYGFLGHWVQICYWFLICVITWRHDVMSWRHKSWFTYLSL